MMNTIHSYWAYLVLAILILAVVNTIIGYTSKKDFKDKDLRISLFTLITAHIQLLIGLGVYFSSPMYKSMKTSGVNEVNRMLAIEHPIMMLLAIVLITIGWSKHKKQTTDTGKFKTIVIFYGLALLLILSRIPWNQWFTN
jgi:NADH:ubiquinone oxidoreductase subunit 2 (subunit N)